MRALPPLLLLAGCTATVADAPSLAPRPIESRSDAERVRPDAVAAPDPALDAEIARLGGVFDDAARNFSTQADAAATRVMRAARAAEGSSEWIDAQAAIGEFGQARSAADAAMADLEGLAIARGADGKPPYPALDARIAAAQMEVDRQAERLNALQASLAGR